MKKKFKIKVKETFTKATVGTLASSILLSSCTQYGDYNFSDNRYGGFAPDGNGDKALLDYAKLYLNDDIAKYINAITIITSDILTNKESAENFIYNTEEYLESKIGKINIILEERDIQFLKAMTDSDALDALKHNDILGFMNIAKEKGIIKQNYVTSRSFNMDINPEFIDIEAHLREIFPDPNEYREFLKEVQTIVDLPETEELVGLFVVAGFVFYVAGLVLIYGIGFTVTYAAMAVVTKVGVHDHTNMVTKNELLNRISSTQQRLLDILNMADDLEEMKDGLRILFADAGYEGDEFESFMEDYIIPVLIEKYGI